MPTVAAAARCVSINNILDGDLAGSSLGGQNNVAESSGVSAVIASGKRIEQVAWTQSLMVESRNKATKKWGSCYWGPR
jgi:hypothetical protein